MAEAFGRYQLLERIGRGGMAEVFKAKSFGVEGFEKILVIKRILPELAKQEEFVNLFIQEAKLAVRLSHANVVQVFDLGLVNHGGDDSGQDKGLSSYFIAMEYVHGFDLATLLARARRRKEALPIGLSVFIASEVAKGLDHAHRRRDEKLRPLGIVHRDVSPQNILLSYEGEVKVTDFGIAKARDSLEFGNVEDTRARKLHGKFGYLSPEQAEGGVVDARSDLFALGIVLYECLAGVHPFSAPSNFETLRRVAACEFPPLELVRPDVPKDLVAIVNMALQKSPASRHSAAGKMYEALLSFLYSEKERYAAHDLAEHMVALRDEARSSPSLAPIPALDDEVPFVPTVIERVNKTPSLPSQPPLAEGRLALRDATALALEAAADSPLFLVVARSIVERHGGSVHHVRAHGMTALFGLFEPDSRDAEIAVRVGHAIIRALSPGLLVGVGVHAARVHLLAPGRPADDTLLDELLSRARSLAKAEAGRCAVSRSTAVALAPWIETEPGPDVDGERGSALITSLRGPSEALGRFVARKTELRVIGEVIGAAAKRHARVITVRGATGIGKTRLLYEIERRLRKGGYDIGVHVATCYARGPEYPLSGIISMLQALCGVGEGDPEERVVAQVPRLRALGLTEDEVGAVLSALGVTQSALPGPTKSLLRTAFVRMVGRLTEDRPHVLAWDNAHALDDESFALLEEAFVRLQTSRVTWVYAARAGFSHVFEKHSAHILLELTELSTQDVERLVAARLGVDRVPDDLLRFVRERAGGHPLFVEEVVRALVEAKVVVVADQRVIHQRLLGFDLTLPRTLRGLVLARVARLGERDRRVLSAAAVLGDPIELGTLSEMTREPILTLERITSTLVAEDMLSRTGPTEMRFSSPFIREVVVENLPPQTDRELRASAARALELLAGDRAVDQAAKIAALAYEAGEPEKAAAFFAKSGERRLAARHYEAAARDYGRALTLANLATRDPAELRQWLTRLADSVRLARAADDAAELCKRVIETLEQRLSGLALVEAYSDAARLLGAVHAFDLGTEFLDRAERLAEANEAWNKPVLTTQADLAARRGDFRRARSLLLRLHSVVSGEGNPRETHRGLISLAQSHAALGDRGAALDALAQAELVLPDDEGASYERQKLCSLIDYYSRDFRSSAIMSERAIDMARALSLPYEVAVNLHNLGDALVRMGDHARAFGALRQSLELCQEFGYDRLANGNRMFLAYLDGLANVPESEDALRSTIVSAEAYDYVWEVLTGRVLLGRLLEYQERMLEARDELVRAKRLAEDFGHRLIVDDCAEALLRLEA